MIFGAIAVVFTKTVSARVLVVFGIGAAISAIAQAKGWPYHVLPALSATILLAALTVSQTVDRYLPISRSGHHLPVAVISATLMVLFYFQAALYTPPFYKQRQFDRSIGGRLQHIIEQNAPHGTILALSPGIYPAVAADQPHRRPHDHALPHHVGAAGRLAATCDDFPALYNPPDTMGDSEKFVFDSVSEDFRPRAARSDRRPHRRHSHAARAASSTTSNTSCRNRVFADAFRRLRAPDGFRPLPDLSPAEDLHSRHLISSPPHTSLSLVPTSGEPASPAEPPPR